MILGSPRECTIGGLRIDVNAEGNVDMTPDGIKTETGCTGNGKPVVKGTRHTGSFKIPCILYPDEIMLLKQKIGETPKDLWPCTVTLINGEVWGFDAAIDNDVTTSLTTGESELEFTALNIRRL